MIFWTENIVLYIDAASDHILSQRLTRADDKFIIRNDYIYINGNLDRCYGGFSFASEFGVERSYIF